MTYKNINIFIVLFFIGTSNALKQDIELKDLSLFEKPMSQIKPEIDPQELASEDTCFCDECFEHFSNKTNLSFHVLFKKHEIQIAQCPFNGCNKFLKSLKELPEHLAQYHDSRQCPCCLEKFLKKTELVRHMNKQHSCIAMPCPHDTCNRWFVSAKEWSKHIKEPHGAITLCPLCLKTFSTQVALAVHVFKHGAKPKNFVCPYEKCSFWTKNKDSLWDHLKNKHTTNRDTCTETSSHHWWRFWQLMGNFPEAFSYCHGLYKKALEKIK